MKIKTLALSLATLVFSSSALSVTTEDLGVVSVSAIIERPSCTASLSSNSVEFGDFDYSEVEKLDIKTLAEKDFSVNLVNCPDTLTLKLKNAEGTQDEWGYGSQYAKNGLMKDASGKKTHAMQYRVFSVTSGHSGTLGGNIALNGTPVVYTNLAGNQINHRFMFGKYARGNMPAEGKLSATLTYTLEYN